MPQTTSDRNLLFGVLALQMDFISQGDLIAAMQAWLLAKDSSVAQILCERGQLHASDRSRLEDLVSRHVERHGSDVTQSLAAVSPSPGLLDALKGVGDGDVDASVARVTSQPPSTGADATLTFAAPAGPGEHGRFQRGTWHAEGAMGVVFHATDIELQREVALKELRVKLAHQPAYRARFIREAQITGGLEHPGIAPIYGCGAYADGRPYYAMRFIRGESLREAIKRYHDQKTPRPPGERHLELHRLLRRFIDVCNTVAFAHSRKVLHRDLKPANIMLGQFGETLVVDWGLAGTAADMQTPGSTTERLDGGDVAYFARSGSSDDPYHTQGPIGTAAFMSPEAANARHDLLNARSDVFSLGCTLYVLLTGKTAFAGDSASEIMEEVRAGRATPLRSVAPQTPRALEAICRKAMAHDPEGRYAGAQELAADVEHWLADEPVTAHAEPWLEQVGRWGRRHRTWLVGAAVFLVASVVGLSASTALVWGEQRKTAQQKDIAERNFEQAVKMAYDGLTLMEQSEATYAADPFLHGVRKNVLRNSAEVFAKYLERAPDDPERRKHSAQVYRYKSNIHRLENETAEAETLLADSIALLRGLAGEFPGDLTHRDRLSLTLRDLGHVQMKLGQLDKATASFDEAMEIAAALDKANGENRYARTLAVSLLGRSSVDYALGDHAAAAAKADRAAERFQAARASPLPSPYDPLLFAAAVNMRSACERHLRQDARAYESHKLAIEEMTALQKAAPKGVTTGDILNYLASCRLEESRTKVKFPKQFKDGSTSRRSAEANFGLVALQWERLGAQFKDFPEYRQRQAEGLQARAELVLENIGSFPVTAASTALWMGGPLGDGPLLAATGLMRGKQMVDDLATAHKLQKELAGKYPHIPAYHAALADSCLAFAKIASLGWIGDDPNRWSTEAANAVHEALRLSPRNASYQETLQKVNDLKRKQL